jgi:hypothetical protein
LFRQDQSLSEKHNRKWIERLFQKIQLPYPITSLIIGGIIFSIFVFFSTKVRLFPLDFFHLLQISTLSVLIAYQLAGIKYLLNNTERIYQKLNPKSEVRVGDLFSNLEHRFSSSYWYYVTVASVIVPFIVIELTQFLGGSLNFFYLAEPTVWSFLLDIYDYATNYFMLFLLAIILWIIFNIARLLNEIRSDSNRHLIKIDIFSIDNIGGLSPLRNFILKAATYYLICVTLAIISFINPFSNFSYESFFLIILLLVGVGFFLMGLETVRKIFRTKIEDEIYKINQRYLKQHQRLMEIVSEVNYKDKEDELNWVKTTIETLHTEREQILQQYTNSKGYDFMTIVNFVGSSIPPVLAYLQRLFLHFGLDIKKFL